MASFIERCEELRRLLGIRQTSFCERIGKAKSVYSNWRKGKESADRDTLLAIADKWYVSLDSLWGRDGTNQLEPSASLRQAQVALVDLLGAMPDTSGSPTERIILCHRLLTQPLDDGRTLLTDLSTEAWLDWINWTTVEWQMAQEDRAQVGEPQIRGCAFFLGWHDAWRSWDKWLRHGQGQELRPLSDKALAELLRVAHSMGVDRTELRRVLTQTIRDRRQ